MDMYIEKIKKLYNRIIKLPNTASFAIIRVFYFYLLIKFFINLIFLEDS